LVWEDTSITLPASARGWRDALSERKFAGQRAVPLAELFDELPLAILISG
jgi:maltooligosyltrehalose synthase